MASASGASEHATWNGAILITNIGLPRSTVRGKHWLTRHRPDLLALFKNLLTSQWLKGLFVCEVGNMSDLLTAADQAAMAEVIEQAFEQAGYGSPKVAWSDSGNGSCGVCSSCHGFSDWAGPSPK